MLRRKLVPSLTAALILVLATGLAGCGSPKSTSKPAANTAKTAAKVTKTTLLTLYGAGTLAKPFKAVIAAFEAKNPGVTIQSQFGGSVKMAKQITVLHQPADILGVADYHVIPKYLFGQNGQKSYADWYVGFVSNAITFVYTSKSKGASRINDHNWYKVLAEPGVQIGRSNPDTDPSGYQTLQMLQLAGKYYKDPGLSAAVLKNSPKTNMRDTETALLGALESGQIDYLAIYRSDAIQNHLKYLNLPARINLSNPAYAADYAQAVAHTKNGDLPGAPIIYGITVVKGTAHQALADKFVNFLVSPAGRKIMDGNGFQAVNPALCFNRDKAPADVQQVTKAWPAK